MMQPIPPELVRSHPKPHLTTHGNASQAVLAAGIAWDKAPLHVKTMAGAYMRPILQALDALNAEIEQLKGAAHGDHA